MRFCGVAVVVEGYGDKPLKVVIDCKDKVRFRGPVVQLINKGRFWTNSRNGRNYCEGRRGYLCGKISACLQSTRLSRGIFDEPITFMATVFCMTSSCPTVQITYVASRIIGPTQIPITQCDLLEDIMSFYYSFIVQYNLIGQTNHALRICIRTSTQIRIPKVIKKVRVAAVA